MHAARRRQVLAHEGAQQGTSFACSFAAGASLTRLSLAAPSQAELLIYSVPPDAFEGEMDDEIEDDEELDDSVQDGADE